MADARKLAFAAFAAPTSGVLIVFCEEGLKFGPSTRKALAPTGDLVERAAAADKFTGKSGSALDIVAPTGLKVARLVVIGIGKAGKLKTQDFVKLGGAVMGRIPAAAGEVTILVDLPGGSLKPDRVAQRLGQNGDALGLRALDVGIDDRLAAGLADRALLLRDKLQIDSHLFTYID